MQIREKRQSVVIYRAKPILSCFFIPNHGKIVCVAVFIQKSTVYRTFSAVSICAIV